MCFRGEQKRVSAWYCPQHCLAFCMFLCNFLLILLKVILNTVFIAAKSTEDFSKGEDGSFSNDVIASNTREMEKQRKRLDKELKQRQKDAERKKLKDEKKRQKEADKLEAKERKKEKKVLHISIQLLLTVSWTLHPNI